MSEGAESYELGDILSAVDLGTISAGSNLLVIGDSPELMHTFAIDLVARGLDHGEGALVISTGGDTESLIREYREVSGTDDLSALTIIDCSGSDERPADLDSEQFMSVDSPGSLTDLGMSFVQYEDQRGTAFEGSRVLFDSISALLEHLDEERVFEFVDAFIGRIHTSQHLGIWLIHGSAHSDKTLSLIMELFESILELRDASDGPELRLRVDSDDHGDWVAFPDT